MSMSVSRAGLDEDEDDEELPLVWVRGQGKRPVTTHTPGDLLRIENFSISFCPGKNQLFIPGMARLKIPTYQRLET